MAKILYVITKSNWGGAQKYVYELATASASAGHDVIVANGGSGPMVLLLQEKNIRTIELPLRQRPIFILDLLTFYALFKLIQIFRAERPDVVHTNSAKAGGLGALAARLTGVPRIIFTAHGWEFNAPRGFFSRSGIRLFSWFTILLSHVTICVSEAVRRDMAWMPGTRKKMVLIHNGIVCPPTLSRAEARTRISPHSVGKFWIGMASELHPTKRVEDAVRAMNIVVRKHPEALLIVMGEGRERPELERLIKDLHLQNRVTLAGFRTDAPILLSAFDLFLHCSQSEALPFSILEAGCASLPVVATRVGGIPEIIEDKKTGLLVPARNHSAIAEAVEHLLDDGTLSHELGISLHERVCTRFSLKEMTEATLKLYP